MHLAAHTGIHIAVIDDDESVCRSMSRLLRAAGYWPVTYPSAEEFQADPVHPHFDCLVLDIQLGGISGLKLHKQLLASGNQTPVIFITAHDDPKAREMAWEGGCAGCFRKSDAGAAVLDLLQRVVRSTKNAL